MYGSDRPLIGVGVCRSGEPCGVVTYVCMFRNNISAQLVLQLFSFPSGTLCMKQLPTLRKAPQLQLSIHPTPQRPNWQSDTPPCILV